MIYSIGYDWSKGMDQTMISVSIAPRITVYCRKYYIILISALFKCLIQHVNFVLYCIVCCLYGNCMVTMVSDNLLLLSFPPPPHTNVVLKQVGTNIYVHMNTPADIQPMPKKTK